MKNAIAGTGPRRLSTKELKAIDMYRRGADLPMICLRLGIPANALFNALGLDRGANAELYNECVRVGQVSGLDNPITSRRDSLVRPADRCDNPMMRRL